MPNPFALLQGDSDDEEGGGAKPKQVTTTTTTTAAAAQVAPSKPAHPDSKKAGKPRTELKKEEDALHEKKKGLPGARGGQQGGPKDVTHPGERAKTQPSSNNGKQHGGGGGGGAGGGGGGGGGSEKREKDRHVSGTGRGKEIKKGGAGGHNWGATVPDVKNVSAATAVAEVTTPGEEEKKTTTEEAAVAPPPEPEDNRMTLEQYEALKAAKRAGAAFAPKTVAKPSTKVEGEAYVKDAEVGEGDYYVFNKSNTSKDNTVKPNTGGAAAATKKTVQKLDIDFSVKKNVVHDSSSRFDRPERGPREDRGPRKGPSDRPSSDRPPRGDRPPRAGGPDRGAGPTRGGGGGGAAGAAHRAPRAAPVGGGAVDTADQSAFPKLGA